MRERQVVRSQCLFLMNNSVGNDTKPYYQDIEKSILRLPLSYEVVKTFKGIIGYNMWRLTNDPEENFLTNAFHDLQLCITDHKKDLFHPRTELFVNIYDEYKGDTIAVVLGGKDQDATLCKWIFIKGLGFKKEDRINGNLLDGRSALFFNQYNANKRKAILYVTLEKPENPDE